MTTPGVKARMPRNVRPAMAGVWVQAVLNLAAGALLPAVVNDAADHGQDEGSGLLRFVAVLSLLIAGALLLPVSDRGGRLPRQRGVDGRGIPADLATPGSQPMTSAR
ncbi:hypothetical protein [Streptomyces sp. NPDC002588]|uniref:hypothetical protein n=1 Tax=Streptomyces sp. NPDC002588 TaxID=3154419 RepID=UPI003328B381